MYHPTTSLPSNRFYYPLDPITSENFTYPTSPYNNNNNMNDDSASIFLAPTNFSENGNYHQLQHQQQYLTSFIHPFDTSFDTSACFDDTIFNTSSFDTIFPMSSLSNFTTPSSSSSSSASPSPTNNYNSQNDNYHISSVVEGRSGLDYQFQTSPSSLIPLAETQPVSIVDANIEDIDDDDDVNDDDDSSDDDYIDQYRRPLQPEIQFESEDETSHWPITPSHSLPTKPDDHLSTESQHYSPAPSSPLSCLSSTLPKKSSRPRKIDNKKNKNKKGSMTKNGQGKKSSDYNESKSDHIADDIKNNTLTTRCTNCETQKTSLWRRNVDGLPLCNACGLFLKLHGTARPLSLVSDVIKRRNRGGRSRSLVSSSSSKRKRAKRGTKKANKK